jgi:hypothetical protein
MTDLRVISLGAGVQSTALYLMALDGELGPRPDVAIFADTQREPPWVYENVWRLAQEGEGRLPIIVSTIGDIGESVRRMVGREHGRFASVPFWSKDPESGKRGRGRRQCTREYKIDVVKREVRRLLGLEKGQRAGRRRVEEWVGISLDEAVRAKPSRTPWIKTRWPFLFDRPMRRHEILGWLRRRGWPEIKKSACVFCPYRSPLEWDTWRRDNPELFAEAVAWDDEIRHGGTRGLNGEQYILDSLRPLRDLPPRAELEAKPSANLDLFNNECEGMCGV